MLRASGRAVQGNGRKSTSEKALCSQPVLAAQAVDDRKRVGSVIEARDALASAVNRFQAQLQLFQVNAARGLFRLFQQIAGGNAKRLDDPLR
jgi:hypothetical protein